jgi:hypothetical protein
MLPLLLPLLLLLDVHESKALLEVYSSASLRHRIK